MKTAKKRPTTSPTPKRPKHEQRKHKPPPQYAYNQAYGQNRQTSNEPPGKTPQVVEEVDKAAEETVGAAEAEAEAGAAAVEETLLQQEDHPQVTPEEETIDFSDSPPMCLLEIARRRKSSSRNGNSITISTTSQTSWEYLIPDACSFSPSAKDHSWRHGHRQSPETLQPEHDDQASE